MSRFDLEKFISECKIHPSFLDELRTMTIVRVEINKNEKFMVFTIDNKQPMTHLLFLELKAKLHDYFRLEIQLIMMHQHPMTDFKECSLWMAYFFEVASLHGIDPFYQIHNGVIVAIVNDLKQQQLVSTNKDTLIKLLQQHGFSMQLDIQIAKQQTDLKEVQYQKTQSQIEKTDRYPRRKKQPIVTVQISELEESMSNVAISGFVFNIEDRPINGNDQIIQTFVLSDENDAITVKRFVKGAKQIEQARELPQAAYVTCVGNVQFDKFKREIGFVANQVIVEAKHSFRKDEAPYRRIEFHTHTKMSEMDGVSDVSTLIEQAFAFRHRGIAITDHLNVQVFPKAEAAVSRLKKKYQNDDFKLVYGVEMNMVEDKPQIVNHPDQTSIKEATYVIFDLETTGLSAQYDHVIEFGAIKIRQHEVIDEFFTFIKPPVLIPAYISQKTNIYDEDVKAAPKIEEIFGQIEAFFKGCVLVAHNAKFDVSFLNELAVKLGKESFENTIIDTLELSRVLLIDRKSFKLGRVARAFAIAYDEDVAHRADYDVKVTHQVFMQLLELAIGQGCDTIADLYKLDHPESFKNMMKSHVQVIAKNQQGLVDLFRLVSISHIDTLAFYKKANNKKEEDEFIAEPRIRRGELQKYREHLLIGAGCFNSEIFEIAANRTQNELDQAILFYDYVEIQPLGHYQPLIDQHVIPDQQRLTDILTSIIRAAKHHDIMVIASGDVHYVHEKDKIFRDIMIAAQGIGGVRHPLYLYDQQKRITSTSPEQHYLNTQEMLQEFSYLDQELAQQLVIENTNLLFDRIEPIQVIKNDLWTPKIDNADEQLTDLVWQAVKSTYGEHPPTMIKKRIEKELDAIKGNGFGVIYLIAHLLVKKSLDDGYLVGSRGSVGSSLVAHLANITEVNPLPPHYVCPQCKHVMFVDDPEIGSGFDLEDKTCETCNIIMNVDGQDIPFETFLGFEGDKVPDIDLNFSTEYQDKAHAYTKDLFGEKNVYRAGTIGTIAAKSAFGYAKGYAEEMALSADIKDARWSWYASGVEGIKRTTGQHPGGIIVVPDDHEIYEFTPIQYPANNPDSAWKTTHFEFADIHDNLLKLDILGHLDPSAMKMLHELTGIDPTSIKMNDPKVMSIFSDISALNVDTRFTNETTGAIGLPEFGTPFVREILRITKPKNFSDLVRISGLSHGTDVWLNNAKDLILSGKHLSDVIGCRDDIMVHLLHKGLKPKQAFDIMESVRKGKGLTPKWIELMKQHDLDDWYIDSCQKIKYMFPKAHAVAYVIMAVRVAWYKVYQPLAYYISYFSLRANAFDVDIMLSDVKTIANKLSDINRRLKDPNEKFAVSNKEKELYNTLEAVLEMKLRGFDFSNIDLYRSQATNFAIDHHDPKALLMPFAVLDGLGSNVARSIVEAREKAAFLSKEDLINRTLLNHNHIKKLDSLGVLDELQEENQCRLF